MKLKLIIGFGFAKAHSKNENVGCIYLGVSNETERTGISRSSSVFFRFPPILGMKVTFILMLFQGAHKIKSHGSSMPSQSAALFPLSQTTAIASDVVLQMKCKKIPSSEFLLHGLNGQ